MPPKHSLPGDAVGIQVPVGRIGADRIHWQTVFDARDKPSIYRIHNGSAHTTADPGNATAMQGLVAAEGALRGALGRLFALAEAYPDLKANQNMMQLTEELTSLGFAVEEDELQTPARAAAHELNGKRVFALVMSGVVPDLEGLELVGEGAEAVLVGGCDETVEPNQVFRYMNLARAFAEIQLGAELYCLHKNRWWQTSRGPLLDAGAFVAGLEYATGVDAIVLGKPSPAYYAAALDALGAEPERTWLVGDDPESDIRGAKLFGMRTALVRTGKFRPDTLDGIDLAPDVVLSSVADLPAWLEAQ